MKPIHLGLIDGAILIIYFGFVLGIGFVLKRHMRTSTDFFLSGRLIPAWVAGLAFLSANLGAQEVIGMAASGAKYGIMTSHFYWVGAIPAMVFVAVFMMPFYLGRGDDCLCPRLPLAGPSRSSPADGGQLAHLQNNSACQRLIRSLHSPTYGLRLCCAVYSGSSQISHILPS